MGYGRNVIKFRNASVKLVVVWLEIHVFVDGSCGFNPESLQYNDRTNSVPVWMY